MFHNAFPKELNNDLQKVLQILPRTSSNNISIKCSEDNIEYILNESLVQLPYRLYLAEPDEEEYSKLSEIQKLMLFCMYTRSYDGFVREKYVKKILSTDFPGWCIPYIVKLCDEYVVEILEVIYERLKDRPNEDIQEFCRSNRKQTRKSYARMTSYWNEYYRGRKFHRYVGRKLFRECLGYSREFEKKNMEGRKILIIGCPGAGKSTFARKLKQVTGLPLFYLDMLWHNEDRTCVSKEEFDTRLEAVLKGDKWIIDGNYLRTLRKRLDACDTVFFLDCPLNVCLAGVESRIGKKREDMPWVEQEFDEMFRQYIMGFPEEQLPLIYKMLEEYKDCRKIIVFKSREEAEAYL